MKNLLCACAFSFVATAAVSGGYDEPIIQPEIVMTETVKSAGSDEWILAWLTVLTIGLAIVK